VFPDSIKIVCGSVEFVLVWELSQLGVGASMTQRNGKENVSAAAYATAADFKQIFTEDISSLYLLSFLLTGNPEKAEQCFVAGIGESTKGNYVFKEWARSWARRTIMQSAIRLIGPRDLGVTTMPDPYVARAMDNVPLILHAEVRAILGLAPFERFVFVMSVLERYSDRECSILLGCPPRDIATSRARAVRRLVILLGLGHKSPPEASSRDLAPPEDGEAVIELMIAKYFATPAWNRSLSL
jgi:DNA-directed RNA polymerase specialized sigma24 family protein